MPVIVGDVVDPHVEAVVAQLSSEPLIVDAASLSTKRVTITGNEIRVDGLTISPQPGWLRRLAPAGWAESLNDRGLKAASRGAAVSALAALAREVAEECRAGASCDVEFIAPPSLEVEGDRTLLRIVLDKLLQNAWKFSSKNAAPKVELGVEPLRNGQPVYYVRDNGAGFDSTAAAAKLFGIFQRFHQHDEFPGTGVGLASVQRIIRKHEGRIWTDSAPGKGATFYFTLAADSVAASR